VVKNDLSRREWKNAAQTAIYSCAYEVFGGSRKGSTCQGTSSDSTISFHSSPFFSLFGAQDFSLQGQDIDLRRLMVGPEIC
jgi:hypothetical protein